MANDDLKKLKELLEIIGNKVGKLETHLTFRSAALDLIKDQQSVINEKLDGLDEKTERVEDKLDALTADVMDLQDQTKAIWDKISLEDDKNKREINEIKEHLGIPTPTE